MYITLFDAASMFENLHDIFTHCTHIQTAEEHIVAQWRGWPAQKATD